MKILHIISSRGWGGAENGAIYLAKKQIEKGNEVFFFIHSFNKKLKNLLDDNGIPYYSIFNPSRKNIFAINKIINICRHENIDIMHTHLGTGNYLGVIASRYIKIPVVSTVNIFSGYPYYAQADAICLDSNAVKDYHANYFSSKQCINYTPNIAEALVNKLFKFKYKTLSIEEIIKKLYIVYERIEESKFIDYNKKLDEFKNYFNIGITGRIYEQKGQMYFIEAAELLLKEYAPGENDYPLMFHIVGSGKDENKLKKTVYSHGLSKSFKFWGYQKDVRVFVNTFDICVSCSLNEPFGINNLEYMFMKKPCIATNTGGIPEVFGDTNILIPAKDPVKLKKALKAYIENKNYMNAEALKGFERVKKYFCSEDCFNKTMDIYMSLINKTKKSN
jgi:glycosyltransferase involved in cell wall biosynthesis